MRKLSCIAGLLLLFCVAAFSQYVSYWFQGWQKQGNPQDAQEYFMRPGTNVSFSYASNRVYINVAGTITNVASTTNALWAMYASNAMSATYASNAIWSMYASNSMSATYASNAIWATNWTGSNSMWLSLSNQIVSSTNGPQWFTNVWGIQGGTNVWFTTNLVAGEQIVSINASNTGGGGGSGATTNPLVMVPGGRTNVFYFTNGSLQVISNWTAPPPVVGATNITNGLTLYWKFNEGTGTTAYDTTSNMIQGTLSGSPIPTWVTNNGYNGGAALSFPSLSGNSYVLSPQTNSVNLTNDFSIGMWICHTNTSWNSFEGILRSFSDRAYLLRWHSPNLRLFCDTIGGDILIGPNNTWLSDSGSGPPWGFLVVTRSNNVFRMYTNGALAVSAVNAGSMLANSSQRISVGTDIDLAGRNWRGHIGEVRIHKGYALTDVDVAYLFTTYYGGVAPAGAMYVLREGDTMVGPLTMASAAINVENSGINVLYSESTTNDIFTVSNSLTKMTFSEAGLAVYQSTDPYIAFYDTLTPTNSAIIYNALNGTFAAIDTGFSVVKSGMPDSYAGINALAVHYGDGALLTNIYGSNIVGAVSEATHATNADNATYATYAEYATNWYGLSDSNLYHGAFSGNGANITNIYPTNITWGGTWSMDGDIIDGVDTLSAAGGVFTNNLYGGFISGNGAGITNINSTNLPSWVAFTPSNNVFTGTLNTFTNCSVLVTGAQYIALSNGTARVLLTNGTLTTSGAATIGNGLTVSAGNALVSGSSAAVSASSFWANQSANTRLTAIGNEMYLYSALNGSNVYITTTGTGVVKMTNSAGGLTVANTVVATNGFTAPNGPMTATNFVTSAVKWIDIPMNYSFSVLGPSAPALTAVTNGSVIQELAFDNNDILYAQAQMQHNVATTNSAFPSWYFEPHVHFTTIGTLDSTHSNVTWRVEWEFANINGAWAQGTNSATMGVTNNYTHYMLELGHITNNTLPHLSAVFRCRLMRPASATQDYSNDHDVLLDAFDLHIPVGNENAIGSSSDNAP